MQQNLFNYTTLSTRLEKTTRTLFVTLNRPDWNNAFRLEMMFELESLFAWCTSRVEINSILISSCTNKFSTGFELDQLNALSASQLEKLNIKMQKIIFSMMQLPQTIIVDLGDGSETLASEFALGADFRLASDKAQIRFNHCHYGLVPGAGGMSMLSTLFNPAFARKWILTGKPIETSSLRQSGFLAGTYNEDNKNELIQEFLNSIRGQAPVQRIQAKLGLFESIRPQLESGIVMDRKVTKASMVSEDWKSKKTSEKEPDFMPAKSMSYSVKLSLIKTEETGPQIEH